MLSQVGRQDSERTTQSARMWAKRSATGEEATMAVAPKIPGRAATTWDRGPQALAQSFAQLQERTSLGSEVWAARRATPIRLRPPSAERPAAAPLPPPECREPGRLSDIKGPVNTTSHV
jgi:hypothetical protein